MNERIRPAVGFKFQENTPYYRKENRLCEVTFDRKNIIFHFERYGSVYSIHMHNDDFDEFLTWYNIAKSLEQARLDTSDEV